MGQERRLEAMQVSAGYDCLAPDGSEIRLLPALSGGSMVHCSIPAAGVSRAVRHRTVEEIWFVLDGHGQVWRRLGEHEAVVDVRPGTALTIPLGTHFQFRASAEAPLRILIVTMPRWPGDEEAVRVADHWRSE
jgi:mannose-6-phosphate isomerase-like protein (cupin superfamily)